MMPDFENVQRSLALKMARSAEERAYLMGHFAGLDRARKQAVVIFIIAVIFMKLFGWV
jgi:hypothetical protein